MMPRAPFTSSRHALTALLLLSSFAIAGVVYAQDAEKKTTPLRASSVELLLDGESVVIAKPDGWVVAKTPKGSVALMRLAGDTASQLDVRYTPGVDNEHRDGHFATFHTNLKSMGLRKVSTREVDFESASFTEGITETVYELTSKKKPYRLVVWHIHRKDAVWFFTLFEPVSNPSSTKPLEQLISAVKIS